MRSTHVQEREWTGDFELERKVEPDELVDAAERPRAPGKRVRAELYEAALGIPRRRRGGSGPGKAGRAELARSSMPVPGTIAPEKAWMRILAREVVEAAAPLFGGARVAASTAEASVQAQVNAGGAAREAAEAALRAVSDAGQPLPPEVVERMGRALGHTFSHVRIHVGAAAAAAAGALGARAFTLGSHIYFAEGEFAPGTAGGDRLLRHELTHVVQYDRGVLRATGGKLEVAEPHSATEVEARAAEDRSDPGPDHAAPPAAASAPVTAAIPDGSVSSRAAEPAVVQAVDARPAAGRSDAAESRGPRQAAGGTATGGVASPLSLGGALIDIVRMVSPRLASLIDGGLDGQITNIVHAAIEAGLKALVPGNPLAGLTSVGASIADIASTLAGAAQGDEKCCATFKTWCEKLGALARKGAASKFVQDFKKGFDDVDKFVGSVVRLFGGALVDNFRQNLNDLRALGGFISQAIHAVEKKLKAAADFVLKALHLPSVDEIEGTLLRLAEKVFEQIKKLVGPAIEALKAVGKALYELSGLKALVEMFKFAGELIEVTKWLIAHRADEDIIKHAHEQMAHTFLPKLLDSMGGLVGKIQAAIAWCESHMAITLGVLAVAAVLLIGPLAILAITIGAIVLALKALWAVIGPTLTKLWNDLKTLLVKAYNYAKPVIDTLTQVAFVISNPWMAPVVIASTAWLLLPECFKGPLIDLFLDLIIALLQSMPNAVVLFGPLWRFVRAGAIGFFSTIKATWSTGDKVKAVNRLAYLGSGRSTAMMAGFVVGVFKGLVYGVIDPFKMVYDLLKMGFDLASFFAKLAAHSPQVAGVIHRYLPQLESKAHQIMSAGKKALDDFLAGRIGFDELWKLLSKFMDSIEAKAAEIGVKAAGKLKGWILGGITDWDIGETIGIVIGYIVVFLLIAYFSAGISAEAEGALAVVRTIAKILNAPYELLGAALKPLEAMFKPVLSALASIGERLGLKAVWQGAMKAFEELTTILGKMVEEIILAIEGKLASKVASILEELAAKVGMELAEKLIAELGEKAAQELVEKLGGELVKKLGETLGPRAIEALADKLGKELLEKLLERGLDAAAVQRLAGKLDAATLQQLLDRGLTAPQIERLSTLTGPRLQAVLVLPDAQLTHILALPDAEFARLMALSDAELARIAALPDTAMRRFLALPPDKLAAFGALPDAAFRRYAGLADDVFAKFAGLDAAGIERFGALSDQAFGKFAALDAPMLQNFAALDVETLRSFAFFDDAALRKFGQIPAQDLAKLNGIDTIALRDFAAMDAADLRTLLANHGVEDIRILGNMTPEKWAESHANAQALDAGGGHSRAKHGAQTTAAQQETRLRTGTAPDLSLMNPPPSSAGRFSSDAAQVEAGKVAEKDLYDNMVNTRGRLKRGYTTDVDVPGAGFSYSLDPPFVPPPPYTGGRVVETMCNRVHVVWELNAAGTDYFIVTMYPIP